MPLDGTHFDIPIDLTELQPGKAGLRQLAYLLCHPEEWPRDFGWDFTDVLYEHKCGTAGCALGIAYLFWGEAFSPDPQGEVYAMFDTYRSFGLDHENGCALFNTDKIYGVEKMGDVTPTMVADAIDFFLATGRVPTGGKANP